MKLTRFVILGCTLLAMSTGCAQLPIGVPVDRDEVVMVRRHFEAALKSQQVCPDVLDADVSISFKNLLQSGTIKGYLQAEAPAAVRFEAVNPFGLTEMIAVLKNGYFELLNVREKKAWRGSTTSAKLGRYFNGIETEHGVYYLLIGRMPPGRIGLGEITRDEASGSYFVDYFSLDRASAGTLVFSPQENLVLTHHLTDSQGNLLGSFTYQYGDSDTKTEVPCLLPKTIGFVKRGMGEVSITFEAYYPDPVVNDGAFSIQAPIDLKWIDVQ